MKRRITVTSSLNELSTDKLGNRLVVRGEVLLRPPVKGYLLHSLSPPVLYSSSAPLTLLEQFPVLVTPTLQFPCLSHLIGTVPLPLSPHRYSFPASLTTSVQFPCLSHPIGTVPCPCHHPSTSPLSISPSLRTVPLPLSPSTSTKSPSHSLIL